MFDRRVDNLVTVNAYLFLSTYDDGFIIEVQVDPEFGSVVLARGEALAHEAAHTSLDSTIASDPKWLDAQTSDGMSKSIYAEEYPDREDVAESFLPYLAVQYRTDRISESVRDKIL